MSSDAHKSKLVQTLAHSWMGLDHAAIKKHAFHCSDLIPVSAESTSFTHFTVVMISSPRDLPEPAQQQLFHLTLRYTSVAFNQPIGKITPDEAREHFEHTFHGDALFIAVADTKEKANQSSSSSSSHQQNEGNSQQEQQDNNNNDSNNNNNNNNNNQREQHPLLVVAHLLVSCFTVKILFMEMFDKLLNCLCVAGICVDPDFQKCKIASLVFNHAVEQLKPKCVALRTVNPAIIRLLEKAAPNGSRFYPADCYTNAKFWPEARSIAKQVVESWDHLKIDAKMFDESVLAFRNRYSENHLKVFLKDDHHGDGGSNDDEKKVDANGLSPADAVLRIVVFP